MKYIDLAMICIITEILTQKGKDNDIYKKIGGQVI